VRPTRWWVILGLLTALPSLAAEPPCPLDVATCLAQFELLRERPWLGVALDSDSTGRRVVTRVEPRSPAQRGGIRPGDVLQSIEGRPPAEWFASKAGWGPRARGHIEVLRGKRTVALEVPYQTIPEDMLAHIIGVHMVEGHLAYLHPNSERPDHGP